MGVLMLKLAGPLQSWGVDSRFLERKTRHEPTKSGVIGLLAAALGRRREEPIDDLAALRIAVRVDQPGRYERDFQTAHPRHYSAEKQRSDFIKKANGTLDSLPLTNRYYVADAVFVVAIEVNDELLLAYSDALLHPAFPLYLGRRSCVPSDKVLLACHEDLGLTEALEEQPWQATSPLLLHKHRNDDFVRLEVLRDVLPGEEGTRAGEVVRDVPVSFSQERRMYDLRTVVHGHMSVRNPHVDKAPKLDTTPHDPMALLEEVN